MRKEAARDRPGVNSHARLRSGTIAVNIFLRDHPRPGDRLIESSLSPRGYNRTTES